MLKEKSGIYTYSENMTSKSESIVQWKEETSFMCIGDVYFTCVL